MNRRGRKEITEEIVDQVVSLIANGHTNSAVANKLSISMSSVGRIIRANEDRIAEARQKAAYPVDAEFEESGEEQETAVEPVITTSWNAVTMPKSSDEAIRTMAQWVHRQTEHGQVPPNVVMALGYYSAADAHADS